MNNLVNLAAGSNPTAVVNVDPSAGRLFVYMAAPTNNVQAFNNITLANIGPNLAVAAAPTDLAICSTLNRGYLVLVNGTVQVFNTTTNANSGAAVATVGGVNARDDVAVTVADLRSSIAGGGARASPPAVFGGGSSPGTGRALRDARPARRRGGGLRVGPRGARRIAASRTGTRRLRPVTGAASGATPNARTAIDQDRAPPRNEAGRAFRAPACGARVRGTRPVRRGRSRARRPAGLAYPRTGRGPRGSGRVAARRAAAYLTSISARFTTTRFVGRPSSPPRASRAFSTSSPSTSSP